MSDLMLDLPFIIFVVGACVVCTIFGFFLGVVCAVTSEVHDEPKSEPFETIDDVMRREG